LCEWIVGWFVADVDVDVEKEVYVKGRHCRYLCSGILSAAYASPCDCGRALKQHHRTSSLFERCSTDSPTTLRAGLCQYEEIATCQDYERPLTYLNSALCAT
jgi:hypothetical protein